MTLDEREALAARLGGARAHVLGATEGLDADALRRAVLPSGWNCLGLLNHLALDVERFWFGAVVAGDPVLVAEAVAPREDPWHVGPEVDAETVFVRYREQVALAEAVLASATLGAAPAWWPPFFASNPLGTVREVVLHVLAETATHAGHLDAVRELIDGRRWFVIG